MQAGLRLRLFQEAPAKLGGAPAEILVPAPGAYGERRHGAHGRLVSEQ